MSLTRRRPWPRPVRASKLAGLEGCSRCYKPAEILGWCKEHATEEADRRFSAFIRRRDGACVVCGTTREQLTCAHVLSRRYQRLRFVSSNAVAMCMPDHMWLQTHPKQHREWFRENRPGLLEKLEELKDRAPLPDLAEVLKRYSGRAA